jgi:hypothetical protein
MGKLLIIIAFSLSLMQYFQPEFNPRGFTVYGGSTHPIGFIMADGSFAFQFNKFALDYPQLSVFQTLEELTDMKGIGTLGHDQFKGVTYSAEMQRGQTFNMGTSDMRKAYAGTDALIPIVECLHQAMVTGLEKLFGNSLPRYLVLGTSNNGVLGINRTQSSVRTSTPIKTMALLLWDQEDKVRIPTYPVSSMIRDYDWQIRFVDDAPEEKPKTPTRSVEPNPDRLQVFDDFLKGLDFS